MKRLVEIYLRLLSTEAVEEADPCSYHLLAELELRITVTEHSLYYVLESENSFSFLR